MTMQVSAWQKQKDSGCERENTLFLPEENGPPQKRSKVVQINPLIHSKT